MNELITTLFEWQGGLGLCILGPILLLPPFLIYGAIRDKQRAKPMIPEITMALINEADSNDKVLMVAGGYLEAVRNGRGGRKVQIIVDGKAMSYEAALERGFILDQNAKGNTAVRVKL